MPPKLLDIHVEIPAAVTPDPDVSVVRVTDAGADCAEERVTFVHFYAAAMATFLEMRAKKRSCN
jgi:hypothetical protein